MIILSHFHHFKLLSYYIHRENNKLFMSHCSIIPTFKFFAWAAYLFHKRTEIPHSLNHFQTKTTKMNTLRFFFALSLVTLTTTLFSQSNNTSNSLLFTIKLMPDQSYGVFVKPDNNILPSNRTATGSGQVTIVAPVDFTYANLENYGGTWVENARVDAPAEASDKSYVSFGFVTDEPKIQLYPNEETLLFTFTTDAIEGTFELIDNETDPFVTPNSRNTNPGNDLGIIDFGTNGGLKYYAYANNYVSDHAVLVSKNNKKAKAVFSKHEEKVSVANPK